MRLDTLLFCEMVRDEASGQKTIVGLVTGNAIGVAHNAPINLPVLSCFAVFDYMQGIPSLRTQCEVTFGSQTIHKTPPADTRRDNSRARYHIVNFQFAPFQGPGLGDYEFKITLEVAGKAKSFARRLRIEQVHQEVAH